MVRSAVSDLDRLLPTEVADEHQTFIDLVVGPAGLEPTTSTV